MTWNRKLNFLPDGTYIKKYGFTENLTKVGDYVETWPLSFEDRERLKKAAHAWAYRKNYVIKMITFYSNGGKCARITLMSRRR